MSDLAAGQLIELLSRQRDTLEEDLRVFTQRCREQAQELSEAYAWHDQLLFDLAAILGCDKNPTAIIAKVKQLTQPQP